MSSFNLSLEGVNAVSWSISSIALALTGGRYFIRWKLLGGFRSDDLAHLVAVLCMLAQDIIAQALTPVLNQMFAFEEDPQGTPMPNLTVIMGASTADGVVLVSGLWAVKIAYMLLYRHIFGISKRFGIAWWCVLAFNVVTFFAAIGGRLAYCGGHPKDLLNWEVCEDKQYIPLLRAIYIWMYVAVVSSDLATMALPIAGLRGLKMRTSQKATIAVVLCLSFITIAFETLRLAESFIGGDALNTLWQNLELEIAVIVSSLPAYYSLINWRRGYLSRTAASSARAMAPSSSRGRGTPGFGTGHSLSQTDSSRDSWGNATHAKTHDVHMQVFEHDV